MNTEKILQDFKKVRQIMKLSKLEYYNDGGCDFEHRITSMIEILEKDLKEVREFERRASYEGKKIDWTDRAISGF